jgi:hypothetical protein
LALLAPLVLSTSWHAAYAGSLVVDGFTDAFPPNRDLVVSQAPVIFDGGFCDGVTCPPDTWVPSTELGYWADQTALPGVLGPGWRFAWIGSDPDHTSWARVIPEQGRLAISYDGDSTIQLQYGTANAPPDWDLHAMGVVAIHLPLEGTITSSQPLQCLAELGDRAGVYSLYSVVLTSPGDIRIPLTGFAPPPEFDDTRVSSLTITFRECIDDDCVGPYPPRVFSLRAVSFETEFATPAHHASWGSLKTLYR